MHIKHSPRKRREPQVLFLTSGLWRGFTWIRTGPEITWRWVNCSEPLLLLGRQKSQRVFSVAAFGGGGGGFLGPFNDWAFFRSASEVPPLPFFLCKACGAALALLFRDKIELQVSCRDPRTKSVLPFMRFSETAVLTSSEISNMCFLLYDK